jgi:hypothetical protein
MSEVQNNDPVVALHKAVIATADKAASATTALEAMQYAQASLNASNALTNLVLNGPK